MPRLCHTRMAQAARGTRHEAGGTRRTCQQDCVSKSCEWKRVASARHSVAVTCPLLVDDDFLLDCGGRSPALGPLYARPLTMQPPSCRFGKQNRLKLKCFWSPKKIFEEMKDFKKVFRAFTDEFHGYGLKIL